MYVKNRMLKMGLPSKMEEERPKRRLRDVARADMPVVSRTGGDAEKRRRWKQVMCCGNP